MQVSSAVVDRVYVPPLQHGSTVSSGSGQPDATTSPPSGQRGDGSRRGSCPGADSAAAVAQPLLSGDYSPRAVTRASQPAPVPASRASSGRVSQADHDPVVAVDIDPPGNAAPAGNTTARTAPLPAPSHSPGPDAAAVGNPSRLMSGTSNNSAAPANQLTMPGTATTHPSHMMSSDSSSSAATAPPPARDAAATLQTFDARREFSDRTSTIAPAAVDPNDDRETFEASIMRAVLSAGIAAAVFNAGFFIDDRRISNAITNVGLIVASAIAFPRADGLNPDGTPNKSIDRKIAMTAFCIIIGLAALLPKYLWTKRTAAEILASIIYGISIAVLWNTAKTNPNDPSKFKYGNYCWRTLGMVTALGGHKFAHAFIQKTALANAAGNWAIAGGNMIAFWPLEPSKLWWTPPFIVASALGAAYLNESTVEAVALSTGFNMLTLLAIWYEAIKRLKAKKIELLYK